MSENEWNICQVTIQDYSTESSYVITFRVKNDQKLHKRTEY